MRYAVVSLMLCLLLPALARAQDVTIPPAIERLAARAADTVNITVDGALLRLAAKFLSTQERDQAAVKRMLGKIKGIYVRSFEFDMPGEYSDADVDSLRSQLKAPTWSRMASVRSQKQGENVDVYLKMEADDIASIALIAAEARRFTFVNIVGPIDLDELASLGGHFGVPKLDLPRGK